MQTLLLVRTCSIILLQINKNLEVSFHYMIQSLSLFVGLGVKSYRKLPFNVEKVMKQRPELRHKN